MWLSTCLYTGAPRSGDLSLHYNISAIHPVPHNKPRLLWWCFDRMGATPIQAISEGASFACVVSYVSQRCSVAPVVRASRAIFVLFQNCFAACTHAPPARAHPFFVSRDLQISSMKFCRFDICYSRCSIAWSPTFSGPCRLRISRSFF